MSWSDDRRDAINRGKKHAARNYVWYSLSLLCHSEMKRIVNDELIRVSQGRMSRQLFEAFR